MYSSYGQWIIRRIAELPHTSRTVAIIRHSERPDFRDIPPEDWNSVLLTSNGERVAVEFGNALVGEANATSVKAEGWGLSRCQLTAEKIYEGARTSGGTGSAYSEVSDLQSPILDLGLYRKHVKNGKYSEMVRDWFNGGPLSDAMKPYKQYSRKIISNILGGHMLNDRNITIIVTHDLYVLPIINQVFDLRNTEVDFLDGILITSKGEELDFFTKDLQRDLHRRDFFH